MIEGINLLISIFIGCIVFIYYTNALFKPFPEQDGNRVEL